MRQFAKPGALCALFLLIAACVAALASPIAFADSLQEDAHARTSQAGDTTTITFPDSGLYTRIYETFESVITSYNDDTKTITIPQSALADTTSLDLRSANIKDLTGIQHFSSLKDLDLCQNSVASALPLASLTGLETLNLYDNGLGDLAGLEHLTNLTTLKLGYNNEANRRNGGTGIKNLDALSALTNLTYLDFSYNWTTDLILHIVNLEHLETLDLAHNLGANSAAVDITQITRLTSLKSVNLFNCGIREINPLYALPNLEKVMLQKNPLLSISGILANGRPVWSNLRELNISNCRYANFPTYSNNAATLQTLAALARAGEFDFIYEKAADTSTLPRTDAAGKRFVTYDDFGAHADGAFDDYTAMRSAHLFANEWTAANGAMCEVRATAGKTYHIFDFYDDPVTARTSTDWMGATFNVHDERIEEAISRYCAILKFDNSADVEDIKTLDFTIGRDTKSVKGLSAELDAAIAKLNALGYTKYYCAAVNSEKRQFMRNGTSKGKDQQDYFNIDRNGKVLNEIQWDFEKLTSFKLTPVQTQPLEVKNGNFVTNSLTSERELGDNTYTGTWDYYYRDIAFENATNLHVSNVNHTISKDCVSGNYNGFLNFQRCSNVTVSDCEIFTRRYVTRSTYDLVMTASTDMLLKNVVSNDVEDTNRYGITGCYFLKDITYDGCRLNRAEAHEGVYNQTIRNCYIGWRGLQVVGGGRLDVIDSTIAAWSMVNLRPDYGSFWNGKVRIIDCTYKKLSSKIPMFIDASFNYTDSSHTALRNFGYDLMFPEVYIDNVTIDYNGHGFNDDTCIVPNSADRMPTLGFPSYWPRNLHLNRYTMANAPNSKVKVRSTWSPIDKLEGATYNYAITDVSLTAADGTDFTREALVGDAFAGLVPEGPWVVAPGVTLTVKKHGSANNAVSVFKDSVAVEEGVAVDEDVVRAFEEDGAYRVEVSSVDVGDAGNAGRVVYEFVVSGAGDPGDASAGGDSGDGPAGGGSGGDSAGGGDAESGDLPGESSFAFYGTPVNDGFFASLSGGAAGKSVLYVEDVIDDAATSNALRGYIEGASSASKNVRMTTLYDLRIFVNGVEKHDGFGKLELVLPVKGNYDGWDAEVYHFHGFQKGMPLASDGVEVYGDLKVQDGAVKINGVERLSPFAVVIEPKAGNGDGDGDSGDGNADDEDNDDSAVGNGGNSGNGNGGSSGENGNDGGNEDGSVVAGSPSSGSPANPSGQSTVVSEAQASNKQLSGLVKTGDSVPMALLAVLGILGTTSIGLILHATRRRDRKSQH